MKNSMSKTLGLSFALATAPVAMMPQPAQAQTVPAGTPVHITTTVDNVNMKITFTNTSSTDPIDYYACIKRVFSGPLICSSTSDYHSRPTLPPNGTAIHFYQPSGSLVTGVKECPVGYKIPSGGLSGHPCVPR